jgi:Domain of unknown function (DUF4397)
VVVKVDRLMVVEDERPKQQLDLYTLLLIQSRWVFLGKSNYLGENEFFQIPVGANSLTITKGSRSSSPVQAVNFTAAELTEYTLFAYGEIGEDRFNITTLTEPVIRPAKGMGRAQILHGLTDSSKVNYSIGATASGSVNLGQTSGFIDLPAGVHQVKISNSGGGVLSDTSVTIADGGELTLVVSGKLDYSFVSLKIYEDLD